MIYKFTVFTPTYNRANLISRVFDSLKKTNFNSFEWIIIDDGSTDDTEAIVRDFKKVSCFPIEYLKRDNKGKVYSINQALDMAKGELFIVFDSDDWCDSDALELIYKEWQILGRDMQKDYSGISCLKKLSTGDLVGQDYSRLDKYGMSYVDRFNASVKGDKWEVIRTDIHRSYKYDLCLAEKYMAPEYAWLKIGLDYKTVFINEPLSIVEYQDSGISRNNILHRSGSPLSAMKFYELAHRCSANYSMSIKSASNWYRFKLHGLNKYKSVQMWDIEKSIKPSLCFIIGYLLYVLDRIRNMLRNRI